VKITSTNGATSPFLKKKSIYEWVTIPAINPLQRHNWLSFGKFQDTERFLIPCPRHVLPWLPPSGVTCKYAYYPPPQNWRDSLPIDMLLCAVSVLVVALSSLEVPEGLGITLYSMAQKLAKGWTVHGSNTDKERWFLSSPNRPDRLWSPPSLLLNGHQGSLPGYSGRDVKLTTHLRLDPRLEMSGFTPLRIFPLHVFMRCKEKFQRYF
jgi:hypothetical protein